MKRNFAALLATLVLCAVIVASLAGGATGPKRLAGPFCIDLSDGTVHAIAAVQSCKDGQKRFAGWAVDGKAGPKGADGKAGAQGADGSSGSAGATGATGAAGADGANGLDGQDGQSITASVEGTEGGNVVTFSDGTSFFIANGADGSNGLDGAPGADGKDGAPGADGKDGLNGADGAPGADGATGAQGPQGDPGPAGPAGADGKDGTVTGTIPVCASNGGNLKLCGGDNGHSPVGYLVLTGASAS